MKRIAFIGLALVLLGTLSPCVQADVRYFSGQTYQAQLKILQQADLQCDCSIALGPEGLKQAMMAQPKGTLYVAYVSAATLNEYQSRHPERPITSLYSEADPLKQIQLAELLTGQRVAVFYSDRSDYLKNRIPANALIKTEKATIRNTLSRLGDHKLVVAIPDSAIWNKESFRVAALSLYRQGKALIGFSDALVEAGSLASLYFDDESYLNEFIQLIRTSSQAVNAPPSTYPAHYRIAVNSKIADSLNIKVPEMEEMLKLLNTETGHE